MTFVSAKTDIDRILRRQKSIHIPNSIELFVFLEIVTHWFRMKKINQLFLEYIKEKYSKITLPLAPKNKWENCREHIYQLFSYEFMIITL